MLVKPSIHLTTVSDEKGDFFTTPDGQHIRIHSSWYIMKSKPYPDEVKANDDQAQIAQYLEYLERDSFHQNLTPGIRPYARCQRPGRSVDDWCTVRGEDDVPTTTICLWVGACGRTESPTIYIGLHSSHTCRHSLSPARR